MIELKKSNIYDTDLLIKYLNNNTKTIMEGNDEW